MKYVIDNSSINEFKWYYPDIFPSFWTRLNDIVLVGSLHSCKEVFREMDGNCDRKGPHLQDWIESNKGIFLPPTIDELEFVQEIFKTKNFKEIVGRQSILTGKPVADPFLIASAKINKTCLITENS